jgi:hypothetical protein
VPQHVAGQHRAAVLDVRHPAEEHHLAAQHIRVRIVGGRQHTGGLAPRFEQERLRVAEVLGLLGVPRLVAGDRLTRFEPFPRDDLVNSVDQQHRIAMREDAVDLGERDHDASR